jgi:predicted lipoprotein
MQNVTEITNEQLNGQMKYQQFGAQSPTNLTRRTMPKQQAFNLGRTITVIAAVMVFSGTLWAMIPAIIGFTLVWYGSTD